MKTTKFFSAMIATIIFSAFTTLNAGNTSAGAPTRVSKAAIRHEVTIHLPAGFSICKHSLYMVRITDERGRLVAPPQVFIPGQTKYAFTESISLGGDTRVASLFIPPYIDPSGCPVTLYAEPDVKKGSFLPGMTFSFDLYPVIYDGGGNTSIH